MNCTIEGCNKPVRARELCMTHYGKSYREGLLDIRPKSVPIRTRPEFYPWRSMIERCTNPKHTSYPSYGARGIKVYEGWLKQNGFYRFLKHIGPRPSREYSIDRIDTYGNYELGNVRWATRHEQAANTRRNLKHVGVSLHSDGYWQVRLEFNGLELAGKTYRTKEEAIAVREYAELIFLENKFNLNLSNLHK